MEPYGAFFLLLSVYLTKIKKPELACISSILMILSREFWIPFYPILIYYIISINKKFKRIIMISSLPLIALFFKGYFLLEKLTIYLKPLTGTSNYEINLFPSIFHGWIELLIVSGIALFGIYGAIKHKNRDIILLLLPQLMILSLTGGFLRDGAMNKYPLNIVPTFAMISIIGFQELKISTKWKKKNIIPIIILSLIIQFYIFNYLSTELNTNGLTTIYDTGYIYDCQVVSTLRNNAKNGELIAGLGHGAFICNVSWMWTETNISKAIEANPDWLIYYRSGLRIENESVEIEGEYFGPYLLINSKGESTLDKAVKIL
jgi:hypothetical protein